ncbi:hypothetical protein ACRJ4W_40420 [Streptomyces sp. GLT-R25]
MGRRTGRWRGRTVLAGAAALFAAVASAGQATAAGTPPPYRFAVGAEQVEGATAPADAVRLTPGTTYRSSVGDKGKLYYGLRLDAVSTAYVSVTAVPKAGTKAVYSDGIKVSLQDPNGNKCFSGDAGAARIRADREPAADHRLGLAPGRPRHVHLQERGGVLRARRAHQRCRVLAGRLGAGASVRVGARAEEGRFDDRPRGVGLRLAASGRRPRQDS